MTVSLASAGLGQVLDPSQRRKLHNILSSLVTSFLHKVPAQLCQLPLVRSEAELAIIDIDKLRELIVGALAALPEVLAEDVG